MRTAISNVRDIPRQNDFLNIETIYNITTVIDLRFGTAGPLKIQSYYDDGIMEVVSGLFSTILIIQ